MAQGGGQAGGMGASPMGGQGMYVGMGGLSGMGGQMQGLGSAPMGTGGQGMSAAQMNPQQYQAAPVQNIDLVRQALGIPNDPGLTPYKLGQTLGGSSGGGMSQPMPAGWEPKLSSVNTTTEQDILRGRPGMQPQLSPYNTTTQQDIMGVQGGHQSLMQVLSNLGFQMPNGIPPMQTPFTQQGQPQVAQGATAQPQPPATPKPTAPTPVVGQQLQAAQQAQAAQQTQRRQDAQAQRVANQQARAARRNRGVTPTVAAAPTPTPTDFSQMGKVGQFGTQGFAQGLQDYLGKNYAGYAYNPTNQTFYGGADKTGQSLTLDQALQQGRAAGFQMARGGIASLMRRR